jgi:hypothetical protein
MNKLTATELTEIQQDFVRRYIDQDGVVGVRVMKIDGQMMLLVDVDEPDAVDLPASFRRVPVRPRKGRRAVLAYC